MENNRTEIIMREGRFYRRNIAEENLGDIAQHIAAVAEAKTLSLMRLDTVSHPELLKILGTAPRYVHAAYSETGVTFAITLPFLPTRVFYKLSEDGKFLLPTFNGALSMRGYICMKEKWTTDHAVPMFFMRGTWSPNGGMTPTECFLALRSRVIKAAFRVPYWPNVYGNGKVCMGPVWENNRSCSEVSHVRIFEAAVLSFLTSAMNADITNSNTQRLFQRAVNKDGSNWVPVGSFNDLGPEFTGAFLSQFINAGYDA